VTSWRGSASARSRVVPQDALAGGLELGLAGGVELLRDVAVMPRAVDLDDQALLWPAQVGEVGPGARGGADDQPLVDVRVCKAGGKHEIQHRVLVAAVGRRRAAGDDRRDPPRPGVTVGAEQDGGELPHAGEALRLGLAHESLQALVGELRGDLEDGASRRRARDPVQAGRIARIQEACAVKTDARAVAMARTADRHVDRAVVPAHEGGERARGPVAEERDVAAGENGGHEACGQRVPPMTHGVYADVQAVQPALAHPPRDGGAIEPARRELVGPDAAVLARCFACGLQVRRCGESSTRSDTHSPPPRSAPRLPCIVRACRRSRYETRRDHD